MPIRSIRMVINFNLELDDNDIHLTCPIHQLDCYLGYNRVYRAFEDLPIESLTATLYDAEGAVIQPDKYTIIVFEGWSVADLRDRLDNEAEFDDDGIRLYPILDSLTDDQFLELLQRCERDNLYFYDRWDGLDLDALEEHAEDYIESLYPEDLEAQVEDSD